MINLLPIQEKKKHLAEYRLRLGIVTLFTAISLVGVSLFLLAPSYALALLKANFIEKEVERLASGVNRDAQEKNIEMQIEDINRKVDIYLNLGKSDKLRVSKVVLNLVALRPDTIKILGITYNSSPRENVVLVGIARDRESLASFVEALRKEGTWGTIKLPTESYVRSKDINFSIKLDRAVLANT